MERLPALLRCGFAGAVFVSALLLFQIQPIVSKAILPWFGGSPAVWTTAMLFFQVVLFLGYLYAHLTSRYLPLIWQGTVHLTLVVVAACLAPVLADVSWKPSPQDEPALRILLLLTATIGLPYFLLAANGPLLQAWFGRRFPGASPYRLYALSNVGSLLALLSYPFVIEPNFAVSTQASQWSLGFGLFAVLLALVVWQLRYAPAVKDEPNDAAASKPQRELKVTWRTRAKWLLLPAWASFGLLAVTNHVCQDMAVVPLLWVAPLSLYLLTFILAFDSEGWYRRETVAWLALVSLAGVALVDWTSGALGLAAAIGVYFASLFFACFACHGELVRLKPQPSRLTEFYLTISAGGAMGGVLVSLICPLALTDYFEAPIFVLGSFLIAGGILISAMSRSHVATGEPAAAALPKRLSWAIPLLLIVVYGELRNFSGDYLVSRRNFYGVLHVDDQQAEGERRRMMFHGRIVHGFQFLDDKRRREPTSYYAAETGVGIVLHELESEQRPLQVGVVGLGAGTLAAYGQPGDTYRMYEINPEVVDLAENYFTYLKDSPAKIEVVLGDGRLSLEAEHERKFDLLVLDAFSGDAIPTHLLTREAFEIYRKRLAPDGVIAVHISNMHVDLRPVVEGLARDCDLQTLYFVAAPDVAQQKTGAHWVVATNDAELLANETIRSAATTEKSQLVVDRLWTDDYSNLLNVLK